MQSVFLSYSFRNEHDPLLLAVRAIIEATGFRVVDGKVLQQLDVSSAVQEKMDACCGVVCVVTPEAHQSGWVEAEFQRAIGAHKEVFALRSNQVSLGNPMQGMRIQEYSDQEPLTAISILAGTMGMWKQGLGTPMRAVLLPQDTGQQAYEQNAKCEYRCEEMLSAVESEWKPARLRPISGAIHAILPGVPFNHSVQVRLTTPQKIWTSEFVPQDLQVEIR